MKDNIKVIFETDEKDYFCIWQTDINAGFYKDGDHVACFRMEDVFDSYCNAKGLKISETLVFDLTKLMGFVQGSGSDFDPSELLNFWNICADLAFTLDTSFLGDDDNETLSEIYDTLFFMTCSDPDDSEERFLTSDDVCDLKEVIADGCRLIISNLTAI